MGTGYVRTDTDNTIETGEIIEAADLDNEFNAVVAAFNATTGHTHDGTSAEGGPITILGPAQDIIVSVARIVPKTTNILDLGSSSFRFKDAFFNGTVNAGGFVGPLTGVASSATVLTTPRNFSITGGATAAAVAFNGSANVVLTVTDLNGTNITAGTVNKDRLPVIQNMTTFQGIPAVTIERATNTINALAEFKTTSGSVYAGHGAPNTFAVGNATNLNDPANIAFTVGAGSGNIAWKGVATGDGSNLTNVPTTALTGRLPNARLTGDYSFDNLNLAQSLILNGGSIQGPSRIEVSTGGPGTDPNYGFEGSGGPGKGMHVFTGAGNPLMLMFDSVSRLEVTANRIKAVNGAIFEGNGSLLTNIPTTALTGTIPATDLSGTVPSARISGSYTGITGTGALNAGSITSGFGDINIGTDTFTGNGSGLTNLDSTALTGTISSARLPTTTQARDWVLARTSELSAHGQVGSYAMLSQISGTAANPGQTKAGSALNYAHAGGVGPGTIAPTGTWMCLSDIGSVGSGDASVGLWLRTV